MLSGMTRRDSIILTFDVSPLASKQKLLDIDSIVKNYLV